MHLLRSILSASLVFGACGLLSGCGKEAKTKVPATEPYQQPISSTDRFLEKQTVVCDGNSYCPNYIAKLVVVDGINSYRFCTGFLTDENTIATSSSCLPSLLKKEGADCSRDVFIFFPKTSNRAAERVGCKSVIQFSNLSSEDPNLWRDDVSFLSLEKGLPYRRQAVISRDGVPNNRIFTAWMVDQQGDFSAIIKRSSCQAVQNNYVNPLATTFSSPNMLFADCGLTVGSSGAPIIDSFGKVRAMISKRISKKLEDSINSFGWLKEPLRELGHGTNFACAPTIYDDEKLDERECTKELSESWIASERESMTSFNNLFREERQKLRMALDAKSNYINFDFKLISAGHTQNIEITPKCFKPLSGWLSTINVRNNYVFDVTLPDIKFKKTMDANGRVSGAVEDQPEKPYFVQFSTKQLKAVKRSIVWMWNSIENRTFPNLSEQCQSSLF